MKPSPQTIIGHNAEINGLMESRTMDTSMLQLTCLWLRKHQRKDTERLSDLEYQKSVVEQPLPEMATCTKPEQDNINGDKKTEGGHFHGDPILRQISTGN